MYGTRPISAQRPISAASHYLRPAAASNSYFSQSKNRGDIQNISLKGKGSIRTLIRLANSRSHYHDTTDLLSPT